MTQKEISVLQAINTLDLDNSRWGIETNCKGFSINMMFPTVEDSDSPDIFLWTWLSEEEDERLLKELKDLRPDSVFESMDDGGIISIWEITD